MTKETGVEARIQARLEAKAAEARDDAELSLPTLAELLTAEAEARAALANLTRLADRVLMPQATAGFGPLRLFAQRASSILDLTKTTAEKMIATAEAIVTPPEA